MAVDLALVVDVLPSGASAAKDLGVLNIAGALPSSVAPAVAPLILALSGGSYGALYAVAGLCALLGAGRCCPSSACADWFRLHAAPKITPHLTRCGDARSPHRLLPSEVADGKTRRRKHQQLRKEPR